MFLNVEAICFILTLHKCHKSVELFGWTLMAVSSAGVAYLLRLGIPISPEVAPNQPNMKHYCQTHHVQTNTAEVSGWSSKKKLSLIINGTDADWRFWSLRDPLL